MNLPFKIAKHFWLDGKNARWSVSNLFDRDVLSLLKDQYSKFEEGRPNYKEIQKKTVFLFYSDAHDVYGRKITGIIAVLVDATFNSAESVSKIISDKLAALPPSILDFSLSIDGSHIGVKKVILNERKYLLKSRSHKGLMIYFVLVVGIIAIVASPFIFGKRENTEVRSRNPKPQINISKNDSIEAFNSGNTTSVLKKDSIEPKTSGVRDHFCIEFWQMKDGDFHNPIGGKCFISYIDDQCTNQNDRKSYKEWVESNRTTSGCEYVKDPDSDQDLMVWKDNQLKFKNLVRNFFAGKK